MTVYADLAGVEIVLNMRRKMEQMRQEMNDFVQWVRDEVGKAMIDGGLFGKKSSSGKAQ